MKNKKFEITEIYEQNINFLIGSGASFGLFPTLALDVKKNGKDSVTIETLATDFTNDEVKRTLLFMHYYKECIEPVILFDSEKAKEKNQVIANYNEFLKTLLVILQRRGSDKRCNIFTTNYDGCFSHVADNLLNEGSEDFVLNDGARGFSRRYLQAKNFNSYLMQSGVFDRYKTEIPQLNLIHLHGSVYWYPESDNIRVDYSDKYKERKIDDSLTSKVLEFSKFLKNGANTIEKIPVFDLTKEEISEFWKKYNKLPIVNPTKWKFHETVFDEHYYQMLRFLSYELERKNTVIITFGFSFADEHILNLVRRSLTNPFLQMYVFCYDEKECLRLEKIFERFKNVNCITIDGNLDFTKFNTEIFTLENKTIDSSKSAGATDGD